MSKLSKSMGGIAWRWDKHAGEHLGEVHAGIAENWEGGRFIEV